MIIFTRGRSLDWIDDFEKTQPGNVCIDEDSFEGSAYYLLKEWLAESKELIEFIKDLVVEPERMSNEDLREKAIFEAKDLFGMKLKE